MPNLIRRFFRLPLLQRLAITLWIVLLLGVTGRVFFAPLRSHTVVPIYLTAAQRWQQGEELYSEIPQLDIYRNPPGMAASFVPLTWLPERLSGFLWRALSATLLLVGLNRFSRHAVPRPLTVNETGVLFSLVAIMAIPSLSNGQTNILMIGALLLGAAEAARLAGTITSDRAESDPHASPSAAQAGFWLALASAIKVYPAAVGLLIGLALPRKIYPWFIGAIAGFFLVPFILNNPSYVANQYRAFAIHVTADDRTWFPLTSAPQDLFLALRVWLSPPLVEVYLLAKLIVAVAMAVLVILSMRIIRSPREVVALAFHLGCLWITVLGPATELPTYVLLAPTAALVAIFSAQSPTLAGRVRFGLALAGTGLLSLPVLRDALPNGKAFHAYALPPIGGTLIFLALIWSTTARIWYTPRRDCQDRPFPDQDESATLTRRVTCQSDRAA